MVDKTLCLAVHASVRHQDTGYDSLLMKGLSRTAPAIKYGPESTRSAQSGERPFQTDTLPTALSTPAAVWVARTHPRSLRSGYGRLKQPVRSRTN
jgi:hypothetical protein